MNTERPWLSPGPPPWATKAERRRPPWWKGLGTRAALVALLMLTNPARAARALAEPVREFRRDTDEL